MKVHLSKLLSVPPEKYNNLKIMKKMEIFNIL